MSRWWLVRNSILVLYLAGAAARRFARTVRCPSASVILMASLLGDKMRVLLRKVKFTEDHLVKRLRWVMIGAMLFSAINTLVCQRASFWLNPETAIRGDGLSVHNSTNHTFEFFLGNGWRAYVAACLIYFTAAFLLVSILPKRAALTAIFTFLFGHFYGATNWIANGWRLGIQGLTFYAIALSTVLAVVAVAAPGAGALELRRLRWVVSAPLVIDFAFTLIGQPGSYWAHPETVHEANALSRYFLEQGWTAFVLYDVVYVSMVFLLVSKLPETTAAICGFSFMFGGFAGASNWLFYEWRMGMIAPVLFGVVLSTVLVRFAFPLWRLEAGAAAGREDQCALEGCGLGLW